MRTLCLNLQRDATLSAAENFLAFSPRVHYRDPGLVFLDVSSTAKMFGGEKSLLREALQVSREFFPDTVAAISDSPWGAQALTEEKPNSVSLPSYELKDLSEAPLSRLHQLEGLIAWRSSDEIEDIVDFFHMLGIHRLNEIRKFQVDSFRERWQDTGTLIWKRLNGLDKQVISPLLPTEALQDYVFLDFPVSLLPFLLHCVEKSLSRLIARLRGRGEFARKIVVSLFCEYSSKIHLLEIEPASPCRDLELFMKLLENKFAGDAAGGSSVPLDNPIKQVQIEIIPCPEKAQQLSLFNESAAEATPKGRFASHPPNGTCGSAAEDKLPQLLSVFHQASITTGFLRPQDEVLPEEAWSVTPEFEPFDPIEDRVEVEGHSFRVLPAHGAAVSMAPRPSRLLKRPRALAPAEFNRYQLLSSQPIERLEDSWWETSRGRDYFFALSPKGDFVWIYYDRIENQHYLHGYFD